jgi:hypothetical protein
VERDPEWVPPEKRSSAAQAASAYIATWRERKKDYSIKVVSRRRRPDGIEMEVHVDERYGNIERFHLEGGHVFVVRCVQSAPLPGPLASQCKPQLDRVHFLKH